ncbi:uncharacterized protein LAJ45_07820 [Morchella importuna]|uniref:uncharacterized protein n=1 Tax=Morchella importuna TaxID=1174673 RepID=UPI001E8E9F2B|nr:uncharacterized protein LAJ45_07820 [Morchella importuna]KAH8148056.1 hypothetical protein LAJ45_07820 [Morchella importuna]
MSDLTATVSETEHGFLVEGYEKISYGFTFLDGVFEVKNSQLASMYKPWGRCLAVTDINVCGIYGTQMENYFKAHDINLVIHKTKIGEQAKTMDTLLSICEAMNDFGIIRKEPVLVVGGGLITDVAGFACASYRRTTNFIRIPTTVIGLIDASVSIKVAVNHGKHKNRLGAYHAPMHTFLDFTFLRTLPVAQVRNGFAELVKISTCADLKTFELLDKYCEKLISHRFGRADGSSEELKKAADTINYRGIHVMLKLETPNLHELALDRVIAYGHTWSPTLELAPETPLRHGHAISVDMAYSATLARMMNHLSEEQHMRILRLFSRAGLTIDHPLFDEVLLAKGTDAILKTRDNKLRAAIPAPLGQCCFLNDVTMTDMNEALRLHKMIVKEFPRQGEGLDAFVDASDTGVPDTKERVVPPPPARMGRFNMLPN